MSRNDIIIFDNKLVAQHKNRAHQMTHDANFLLDHCRQNLNNRFDDIKQDFNQVIDLAEYFEQSTEQGVLSLEADQSCFISHLNLHWVNDLPGCLYQIRQSLRPDGLFLASLFGGETLSELRESMMMVELEMFGGVSPRVSPFATLQDLGGLLQRAGFALPVVDHEMVTVTYPHVFALIKDLRAMGQTNTIVNRSKRYLGKEFWPRVQNYYQDHFSDEKRRIVASFNVFYLIGWAPAATQQQPLKPGSAQKSLAQVLKTTEIKLPEKARSGS